MKAVSIVADSRHSNQNLNYSNCNDSVSSHRYTKTLIRHVLLLYCACSSSSSSSEESENSKSNRPLLCDANVPTAYLKCILGPLLFLLHLHPSAVPPSLPSRYLRSSDPPMRISFSLDFNSRFSSSSSIPPILFPCTRDWGPPHLAQIASTQSVHAAVVTRRTPQGGEEQNLEYRYISRHFFSGYIQPKCYI